MAPAWMPAGPARCCSSTTCGLNSAGLTTPSTPAAHGVLSSLSVPLPFQGATIGALNTYAKRPRFLDDRDVELAEDIAAWIAIAIGNAEAAAKTSEDLSNLRVAMMSRAVIEQAKGILMERHKIKEDEAFTILTHACQRTNIELRDMAEELVRTGALPG